MKKQLALTVLVALAVLAPTAAQAMCCKHCAHHAMPGSHATHAKVGGMPNMAKTKKTAADRALYDVSVKMHHNMDVALIGTPDADFVRAMIPHHQGAIDMAQVVLKHGSDTRTAWLARNIIKAQNAEIYWMNRWLSRADQRIDVPTGNSAMEKSADTLEKKALLHIHHGMHQAMDVDLTGDADSDFVRAMIPHHQGAIDMAVWVIENGQNPEVKDLARDIIKAQQGEIKWMKNWLKDKNAKAED